MAVLFAWSVPATALGAAEALGPAQGLQVLAGLAIVLALIAAVTWGARRLQGCLLYTSDAADE